MSAITNALGAGMGLLIALCYRALNSYTLSIILFTLITKVILFPISLWTHQNSLKMVSVMPEVNELKVKYYGDKDTIAEETQKLYKRVGYHPLLSTVPMIIQIILLMGVVGAIKQLVGGSDSVLTLLPSEAKGLTLLVPVLAGLAALTLGLTQNHINALQREQSKAEQFMTNGISVCISLFLGAFVPVGTGLYWIFSNLFSILNQLALNAVVPPAKHIDYPALRESQKKLKAIEDLSPKVSKEDKAREKADYKRFFSVANKHLVFYSEKSGFYKYFKNVIEYLLDHSNVIIHYVTSDPRDQIFELAKTQPKIRPYYICEKRLITLFMKMDADIVVMTTPDLDNLYLKRSYVRKDIEYIYMFHGIGSTNMVVREGAYDHFDTVFCVGQHQIDELRETEAMYHLPAKELLPCGYGMFDDMMDAYEKTDKQPNDPPKILIAPSWQEGNILDSCIDEMMPGLLEKGYEVIIRPHPEYIKRFPDRMNALLGKYGKKEQEGIVVETNFSSNATIFSADLLLTDWSGIAYEFSFCTLRPCLFIDTPMKVLNPAYTKYQNQPSDIVWRNKTGRSLPTEEARKVAGTVEELLAEKEKYCKEIQLLREKSIFHMGKSGAVGGKYILGKLKK